MNNMNSNAEIDLMLHLMRQVMVDDRFPQDIRIVFGTILVAFRSLCGGCDDTPNIDDLREESIKLFEALADMAVASGFNKEMQISTEIVESLRK